jgi:uncharacterized protein YkwD
VDPFVIIMVGLVGGLLVALILLGLFYPGSGADQVNWKPTRSVETEVQNEIDDLDQMLEAANEKRRARGAAELTEEGIHERVAEDRKVAAAQREAYLGDIEIEQMLDIKNERRARKGLAPLSADEYRAQLEAEREEGL